MNICEAQTRWTNLKQRLQQSALATSEASNGSDARTRDVFRQRAARFATAVDQREQEGKTTRTLTLEVGDQVFGIPLCYVAQVFPACTLTPVPRAPSWVLGLANIESQVRSVVELATLIGVAERQPLPPGPLVLVRCEDGTIVVRVDRLGEVKEIATETLAAADSESLPPGVSCIRGIAPGHVAILSIQSLIARVATLRGEIF